MCLLASLVAASHAEDKCGSEVKILLEPSELHSVLEAFPVKKKSTGSVYFFDTNNLNLLSAGLILRVRSDSADSNLTVKLRLPESLPGASKPAMTHGFKCEVDVVGDKAIHSYSNQSNLSGAPPKTGQAFLELLSTSQKQLLEQASVSVDWAAIRRFDGIKSTSWQIKGRPPYTKLSLELWEWSSGTALEISTKVSGDSGAEAYEQLRQIVMSKGLTIKSGQMPKTTLALERFVGTEVSGSANTEGEREKEENQKAAHHQR